MLRVSLSLHLDPDFPDTDSDVVTYVRESVKPGDPVLWQPWFRVTPQILAWLGDLLNRAAKSIQSNQDSSAVDRWEVQRMRAVHDDLIRQFGISEKGKWEKPEYLTSEEMAALDNFIAEEKATENAALAIPGPLDPRSKKPTPGKILAWRPRQVDEMLPKILGGVRKAESE